MMVSKIKHTTCSHTGVKGFTLIELLVAMVIVGIVAGIALPSYKAYTKRGNRSDGEATLIEMLKRQNSYLYKNGLFTTDLTDIGYPSATSVTSSEGKYVVAVASATTACPITSCVVLRATPQAGQTEDGILELTSTGLYRRDKNGDGDTADAGEDSWK